MITVGIDLAQKGDHHVAIRHANGDTDAGVRSLGWNPQEWDRWATAIEGRRQTATEPIQALGPRG